MAYDKVIDSTLLNKGMTATANAIRAKTGDSSPIAWDSDNGFEAAVEGITIEGGIDTSDATATAADMLAGATAYVNGEKIEGTLIEIPATHSIAGSTEKHVVEASGNIVSIGILSGENVGSGCIVRPGAQIIARIPKEEYGTATAADVAKGKTFTSAAGLLAEGTHVCEGGIDVSKGNVQPYEMSQGKIAYTKDGEVVGTLIEVLYDETEAAKILTTGDYAKIQKSDNLIVNLGRYASASIGDNTKGVILRPGAIIGARMPAEMYGDATENDVREGVTFTSENGVKLTGKASFDNSNGSSLPSGISNIKTGVWTHAQDYNADYVLNHNLGTIPDLFYIYQEEADIFDPSSNKGYINCETLIFKPQPFAGVYGTGTVICGNSSGTSVSSYNFNITTSPPTNSTINIKASNTYKFKAGTSYRWIAMSF